MTNPPETPVIDGRLTDEQIDEILVGLYESGLVASLARVSFSEGRAIARAIEAAGTHRLTEAEETIAQLSRALREAVEGPSLTALIRPHILTAGECPPGSRVVLVSSLLRLTTETAAGAHRAEPLREAAERARLIAWCEQVSRDNECGPAWREQFRKIISALASPPTPATPAVPKEERPITQAQIDHVMSTTQPMTPERERAVDAMYAAPAQAAPPTNAEDASAGNVNAIRHIAYAEGYRDGKVTQASSLTALRDALTSDERYWLSIRPKVIAALAAVGYEIWSDKDRVWLHKVGRALNPGESQT